MSFSSMYILPLVGVSMQPSMFRRVVFPEPLRPSIRSILPLSTVMFMSWSIIWSLYSLHMFSVRIIGSVKGDHILPYPFGLYVFFHFVRMQRR